MMDLFLSILVIVAAPVHWVVHPKGKGLIKNAFTVLAGNKTWVGYASASDRLPGIKKSIITHMGPTPVFSKHLWDKADNLYAKNYDWWQDVVIVFQHYRRLA